MNVSQGSINTSEEVLAPFAHGTLTGAEKTAIEGLFCPDCHDHSGPPGDDIPLSA
ncbi:hypothetical protein SynBIOSE41_03170 [Synechococcus sp. BIOS-E4-1]|nr:hypothetical protein SynBIOSE41_03170 [Synechococcus sp. BIOS-E4-1]